LAFCHMAASLALWDAAMDCSLLRLAKSSAVGADGRVRRVEILTYRESCGFEVANAGWLAQFAGKTSGSALEINQDIRNISGATLSSRHADYATHLR
jgi:FMN-binding protein